MAPDSHMKKPKVLINFSSFNPNFYDFYFSSHAAVYAHAPTACSALIPAELQQPEQRPAFSAEQDDAESADGDDSADRESSNVRAHSHDLGARRKGQEQEVALHSYQRTGNDSKTC